MEGAAHWTGERGGGWGGAFMDVLHSFLEVGIVHFTSITRYTSIFIMYGMRKQSRIWLYMHSPKPVIIHLIP